MKRKYGRSAIAHDPRGVNLMELNHFVRESFLDAQSNDLDPRDMYFTLHEEPYFTMGTPMKVMTWTSVKEVEK